MKTIQVRPGALRALQGGCRVQNRLYSALQSRSAPSSPAPTLTSITGRQRPQLFKLLQSQPTRRGYAASSIATADSGTSSSPPLQKTALYEVHLAHGAKMVPFGGYHMPVQYGAHSVSASHHFTRNAASLFDVGHMVQHYFSGPGAAQFLERVTPSSVQTLPEHQSTLSALLHPNTGGIVDDLIITRLPNEVFYVVTNAGCREKDLAYFEEQKKEWTEQQGKESIQHKVLDGHGLIALQGPLAAEILAEVADPKDAQSLDTLYFGQSRYMSFPVGPGGEQSEQPFLVSRGGYTGEDGFEISVPDASETVAFTEALLAKAGPERLKLAGLGARDSLRLEAGMCLYGHDLDDTTTPVEAGLGWIIGKERRGEIGMKTPFHGAEVILPQITVKSQGGKGVERRRVGFVIEGAPAREGAGIISLSTQDGKGEKVGVVTSGCPSPTLGKNIAMGYIREGLRKAGTEVEVSVRGRLRKAVVTKMPFVPAKYRKGAAPT